MLAGAAAPFFFFAGFWFLPSSWAIFASSWSREAQRGQRLPAGSKKIMIVIMKYALCWLGAVAVGAAQRADELALLVGMAECGVVWDVAGKLTPRRGGAMAGLQRVHDQ